MQNSTNINNFVSLYKRFVYKYVLKLIGEIVDTDVINTFDDDDCVDKNFEVLQFDLSNKELVFGIKGRRLFKKQVNNLLSEDDVKLLKCIINKYFKICIYNKSGKKQHNYISITNENINYEYAIQAGICNWVVGDDKKLEKIENLFSTLESWSLKTYEGKNVSYGLVIDLKNNEEDNEFSKYGSFINFLNDEFSAVITDPITSVFELSVNCKLLRYRTIIDENANNKVDGYELINNLPYRFANIISKTVDTSDKIGIFLLNNGDIILAKNKQILFVKRNSQWLNFNIKAFNNSISDFVKENNINPKLISEVYSTALDVSFSHTGGIIAIIPDETKIISNDDYDILDKCDYVSSNDSLLNLENYLIKKNNDLPNEKKLSEKELVSDINKKMLKRAIIKKILKDNYDFIKINRKLRSELVSLDGACILNTSGKVCAFGAIIQNDSGSTGGGRGAAAKKLSTNAMAIKISTDGYIEVYVNQRKKYVIK